MDSLSARDRDVLAHLRRGDTLAAYARQHSYSTSWQRWKSRELRRKLGVGTIREVYAMSENMPEPVSRADFEKLLGAVGSLSEAVDALRKSSPSGQPQAQQVVAQRELDLKDHARALGLTLDDVQKIREEKDYERFLRFQERQRKELEPDDDDDGDNGGEPQRDGLGGIRNLIR